MKTSVKARAVAMGAMFLFHAMLSQQAVRAAFVDDGDNRYRITTDAPNPFTDPVSVTVNSLHFAAGAGLEVVGGTHALQMTTTGDRNISIVEGSYITHTSANGAAVDWSNGGTITNYLGSITGGDIAIRLNASEGYLRNYASISGTNVGIELQGTGSLSYVYNYHVMDQAPGSITSSQGSAITFDNCGGWVENEGLIEAEIDGVSSSSNVQLDVINFTGGIIRSTGANGAGISILHGTISNYGLIQGARGLIMLSGNCGNTATGEIIGTADVGMLVSAGNPSDTYVTNLGLIQAINQADAVGLEFAAEGEITNASTGTIRGANIGVLISNGTGTVELTNAGDILGDTGDGIRLTGNGSKTLTNQATGLIQGAEFGLNHHDGNSNVTLTNHGEIASTDVDGNGVRLRNFSELRNYGEIAGGSSVAGYGAVILNNGILRNYNGSSIVAGNGVMMSQGTLDNKSGALIESQVVNGFGVSMGSNGIVVNAGQILAEQDDGVGLLHSGGSSPTMIDNAQTGLIRAHSTAIDVTSDIGTISNSGDIISTHGVGIMTFGVVNLINDAYGEIHSYAQGILVQNGGAAAYMQNAGLIESTHSNGVDIRQSGSTFINGSSVIGALNDSDLAAVRTIGAVYVYNTNGSTLNGGNGVYSSGDQLTLVNEG
ncbi:MAG: hypothetical protein HC898_05425, partial [Phycisphaerales bacterium]|nr:hypothetical protein [Phycisphaerales bacterium]